MSLSETKQKKCICAGLLAHVDAGKTTLSEAMLYVSGNLKKLGRVDHQDAFLDTYHLERERGITIFSKQAILEREHMRLMLLDTPGHVDFSTEMERTLQVLDYAILVISGSAGVQGHTETLWKLLEQYRIPTFVFINKMDLDTADYDTVLAQLKSRLSDSCVDFSFDRDAAQRDEEAAMCDESLMEAFVEEGALRQERLGTSFRKAWRKRPTKCLPGSAVGLK